MKAIFKRLLPAAALVAALALPLAAQAQTGFRHARGINARQQREQARIRVQEAYARRSGGELTAAERARIERQLNQASRDIYRQKHDRQDRN